MKNPWIGVGFDVWRLSMEASTVIAQRSLMLAAGGAAAQSEAARMVREKVEAGFALQAMALSGGLGVTAEGAARKTIAHYRRRVRANRSRLTRSR